MFRRCVHTFTCIDLDRRRARGEKGTKSTENMYIEVVPRLTGNAPGHWRDKHVVAAGVVPVGAPDGSVRNLTSWEK